MAILRTTLFWGKACRRNGSQGLFHRNPFSRKGLSRIFLERVAATLSRSSCIINMKIYFLTANFACFILLYFFATHLRDADNFYTPKALFHFWSFMPDKIRTETNFKIVHFFVNETSFSTHKLKKSDLKLSHLAANRENRRCTHNTSWTKQCSRNHNLQTKKNFGLVLFWQQKCTSETHFVAFFTGLEENFHVLALRWFTRLKRRCTILFYLAELGVKDEARWTTKWVGQGTQTRFEPFGVRIMSRLFIDKRRWI